MIKRIGHTAYTVENMEKSLEFYCDILGLQKLFELHNENDEPWIVYVKVCGGQFIELFYGGEKHNKTDERTIGYQHLCLEVNDINEIANHLKAKGITLSVEPQQGLDKNYQCWAKDPDGNPIEFMELHPGSPQLNK